MFLHCAANNLLVQMRRRIASPPEEPTVQVLAEQGSDPWQVTHEIPAEASTGRTRRKQFNRRRKADPLGEGQAMTWRMMLIKVASRIKLTARRVRVFLSGSWPYSPLLSSRGSSPDSGLIVAPRRLPPLANPHRRQAPQTGERGRSARCRSPHLPHHSNRISSTNPRLLMNNPG